MGPGFNRQTQYFPERTVGVAAADCDAFESSLSDQVCFEGFFRDGF